MRHSGLLSSITYTDTERFIEAGEMKIIRNEYRLQLFDDGVATSESAFPLSAVWDVSYKSLSTDANLLYLHTHRGVITYQVYEDPADFVKAFKKLKNIHY
jgi:hypothetical protein